MNQNNPDIKELQARIALTRDARAYEALYKHYYKPLILFSETITRSKEGAEEVYSDVLLKLWNMGEALNEIANLKVYLYQSVRNASLNYIAKYQKVRIVDIEQASSNEVPGASTPLQTMLYAELNQKVALIVRSLPPKAQQVYRLVKEEHFRYKEVADILAISVSTVEGHMTTALKKIALSLHPYLNSSE